MRSRSSFCVAFLLLVSLLATFVRGTGALAAQSTLIAGTNAVTQASAVAAAPPTQPELVASLAGDMRKIVADSSYAYVGENIGASSALVVYDISRAPNRVGSVNLSGYVTAIARSGSIVYIAANPFGGGLASVFLVDISNPRLPKIRSTYQLTLSYTINKMAPVGTRLYLGGDQFSGAIILNTSNPDNPVLVSMFGPLSSELFAVDGNRAVIGGTNTLAQVFDITDPDHPKQIGSLNTTGSISQLAGNRLYTIRFNILSITDITRPADQALLGTYSLNASSTILQISGTHMYVVDPQQGVIILDVSNPAVLRTVGAYHLAGVAADAAVVNGFAYVVGTFGMQKLSISGVTGPRFLSGFTFSGTGTAQVTSVQVVGSYAYATIHLGDPNNQSSGRLYVIDISNPSAPAIRASYNALKYAYSAKIIGGIAYVADESSLEIIDVSNPARPRRVGGLPITAQGVVVVGKQAYVLGLGMTIVDVANPSQPRQLSHVIDNYDAQGVDVVGNLAYVSARNGLSIYNISNPSSPTLLGHVLPNNFEPGAIRVANNIAYAAGSSLVLFDVSNPAAPTAITGYSTHDRILDVETIGNTAYVAASIGGLQILQIGSPFQPALSSALENGLFVERLDVSGSIAITGGRNAIQFLDLSAVKAPTLLGRIDRVTQANAVRVANGVTYIAGGPSGLQIYDTQTPATPYWLASYIPAVGVDAQVLEVAGNLLYLDSPQRGIDVIDISTPSLPRLRANVPGDIPSFFQTSSQLVGKRLYLSHSGGDFSIYDLSNPLAPKRIGFYNYQFQGTTDFRVVNTTAYISVGSQGLHIVDVTNGANPKLIKIVTLPHDAGRVVVENGLAYVANPANGDISVVNVTNPQNPSLLGSFSVSGNIGRMQIAGTTLFVSADGNLYTIDVSNIATPVVRGTLAFGALADQLVINGRLLYAAFSGSGLQIFWYVPASTATIGTSGGTLLSQADQTSYSFQPGTFAEPTTLTHTPRYQLNAPPTGALVGIDHAFELTIQTAAASQPAATAQPYRVTVHYTEAERGVAIEATLALYVWDGSHWLRLSDSALNPSTNTVTATTTQVGLFAVLGETHRAFIPLLSR